MTTSSGHPDPTGHRPLPIPQLTTTDTALLLIDLQNGFVDPQGFLARRVGGLSSSLATVVEPARKLLVAARTAGIPVIHTQHAFEADYADGGFIVAEVMPRRAFAGPMASRDLIKGSWEADFVPRLEPIDGECVIHKNRYDAFIGTRLERLLNDNGSGTLVVCGVVTTLCVESTVRGASMRDFRVYLTVDALGDIDDEAHTQSVARLSRDFAHPITADAVATAWSAKSPVAS